jgi:dihydroflavonol-4-reductase
MFEKKTKAMKRKKVIITGADGVLGSNLVREFLSRDYEVSVFLLNDLKDPVTLNDLKLNYFYGNILDKETVYRAFEGQDYVVHAAASTVVYPARFEMINMVNIEGTKNVIDAVLKNNITKLIHVGTANSFSYGTKDKPGNETNPYKGYVYGLDYIDSKKKAQDLVLNAVKENDLNAVVLNPTFMIGPYDSKPSSGSMIIALKNGKIPGYTVGAKNYIAVKDAAVAIANAIDLGKKGECYILGNHNMSFKNAFEVFANVIGVKPPKRKLSSKVVILYGAFNSFLAKTLKFTPSVTRELAKISCEEQYYCSCKAREELKMPITPIEVAVKECYEWFIENGYIKLNK